MSDLKDQNEPKEMEKYGVACSCAKGQKPSELEKTAELNFKKCSCCGRLWQDATILPYDKKK